jgi:predicted Zn-dependent protease
MKGWYPIIFMVAFGISYLLKDVVKMKYRDYKAEQNITEKLKEKYPNYQPGTFWTLLSRDFGTANPPYYIQHIYSEGNDQYKFAVFNLDGELNITSEEKEKMLQFDKPVEELEGFALKSAVSLNLMLARQYLADDKPYEAIVTLQELLQIDSTSIEAKTLLAETLTSLKK